MKSPFDRSNINFICILLLWNIGIHSFAEAHFYISEPEILSTTTYESVPISWGANPLIFSPVQGYLVLHNQTDEWLAKYGDSFGDSRPNLILVCEYPGYSRPYVDQRIVMWQRLYRPAAAIFVGESIQEGTYQQVGELDQIKLGTDTSEAKYPILQTHWRYWRELRPFLANNSLINASVTDQGVNAWKEVRRIWFPIWISICMLWCLTNIFLAARALFQYPCIRILPTVILMIELVSNILRIPFLMDPYGVWFIPIPLIHVFFSMSWPLHLCSCIIVVFFWWELVAKTKINISSGFITSGKTPAIISIVIMVIVEYTTASLRAAGFYSALLSLNAAVYVIVLVSLTALYFYVFVLVFRFLRNSPVLRSRDGVLRAVSFRFFMTAITFIFSCIFGLMTITRFFSEALGQSVIHFLMYATINAGSTCTLSAFAFRPGMKTKNGSTVDSTVSSKQSRTGEISAHSLSWSAASSAAVGSNVESS